MISPDKLMDIPEMDVLPVGYYPESRLKFVDTDANPATCVGWEKIPPTGRRR